MVAQAAGSSMGQVISFGSDCCAKKPCWFRYSAKDIASSLLSVTRVIYKTSVALRMTLPVLLRDSYKNLKDLGGEPLSAPTPKVARYHHISSWEGELVTKNPPAG